MTIEDGLLGGIAGAFSGLTSADVDALATVAPGPAEPAVDGAVEVAADAVAGGAAQQIAARLLRRAAVAPARPTGSWELIDEATGRSITLADAIEIGRGEATSEQLRLTSSCAHVSRRHGCIAVDDDGNAAVADLGSANGTVVLRDGETIPVGVSPIALVDGDRIATLEGLRPIATVRHHACGDDR